MVLIPDYERRLDKVFYNAFETNDPPLKDWAMIKFELRKLRLLLEEIRDEEEVIQDEEE